VLPSQSAIYVVFRGSDSIPDWIANINVVYTAYNSCTNCFVHSGFYASEQAVINFVKSSIRILSLQYPTYQVIVTGHSLGAAIATFTAVDLLNDGFQAIRLFNFGSPRVGNYNFAVYASNLIQDRNRVTHRRDIVPHLPWQERFTHISGEWYEDNQGLRACDGYEDPTCSYQWYILSIDDHMQYLGLNMSCDSVSSSSTSVSGEEK
jgi:hypothetical protein